jgi:hypothetical protein
VVRRVNGIEASMILSFPPRPANDNDEGYYWTCHACQNSAFLLEFAGGRTTIHCAVCLVDVTEHIVGTIPIDLSNA